MFEVESGNIYYDRYSIYINQGLSCAEFCESELFKKSTPFIINPPYYSYKIDGWVEFLNEKFTITIFFAHDKLSRINLHYYCEGGGEGWESWSEEAENEIKTRQDDLLRRNFGNPPYEYKWGKIESVFDKRSGDAHLIITYK